MRALLPVLVVAAVGLAPGVAGCSSEDGDTVRSYETALFTLLRHGDARDHHSGHLVLVDAAVSCAELADDGLLRAEEVARAAPWAQVIFTHGVDLDGWLRAYESERAYRERGGGPSPTMAWYSGEHAAEGGSGHGVAGADDEANHGSFVRVEVADDDRFEGVWHHADGTVRFQARKCPMIP